MAVTRLHLDGLRAALDWPSGIAVTEVAAPGGSMLDVTLSGVLIGGTEPEEVVAEYEVDVNGHRAFIGFRVAEGPSILPLGTLPGPVADAEEPADPPVESSLPASGPGSRGARRRSESEE